MARNAAVPAAASASTGAESEPRAEAGTKPEPGAEAARAHPGGAAGGHLLAKVLTKVPAGVPTCGSGRREAEAGLAPLRAVEMWKWGIHGDFSLCDRKR